MVDGGNTVTRLPHTSDAEIGRTVRGWEGDVNDLFDVADVASEVAGAELSRSGDITLTEDQVRRILFCTYLVYKHALALKNAYYAAIEGK